MFFSRCNDITLQLGEDMIIGLDHFQVDGNALLDGRVIEPFDDAFSVLGFGNASQEVGEVILASGVLDMGKEFSPFSHEVISSSEEIPGCPHPGRDRHKPEESCRP